VALIDEVRSQAFPFRVIVLGLHGSVRSGEGPEARLFSHQSPNSIRDSLSIQDFCSESLFGVVPRASFPVAAWFEGNPDTNNPERDFRKTRLAPAKNRHEPEKNQARNAKGSNHETTRRTTDR
jgi:hypothetical protein